MNAINEEIVYFLIRGSLPFGEEITTHREIHDEYDEWENRVFPSSEVLFPRTISASFSSSLSEEGKP
jgi:hypothetical protein